MTQNPVARSTATLPHHSSHGIPRPAVYNPDPRELYPGPRNRLFLALKSTVPSEVDWALPRLVLASFDHAEAFKLETWIDSVAALQYWPERWLEELEKEATLLEVREGRVGAARDVLAVVPEWTKNQPIETRAVHSLLVLRNASFIGGNAKLICRAAFLAFVNRFFALPLPLLLNLSLRSPEPFAHILVILQSVLPYLGQYPNTQRILTITLPAVLVETRDVGMLHHIFPLIISALALPGLPPPPDSLTLHLLYLLTLTPPMSILELTLDLLVSLTLQPTHARQILALPGFPAHLRSLVILLEHSARQVPVSREAPPSTQGVLLRNPASEAILAEEASRRRTLERDVAARKMELFGGGGVAIEVGDKPPALSPSVRSALFAMGEPRRSITWMHETFVYSSTSQLLQVTFWHAYRDFFQNPATVEPLLSASEVIKNVTIAFPGASAKVWTTDRGENKFVIAGMGFRKSTEDEDRYTCLWHGCTSRGGNTSTAQLLSHIQSTHLGFVQRCHWATCRQSPVTLSHVLTHLPLSHRPPVPDQVSSDSRATEGYLSSKKITQRPIPPLPRSFKLHFTGQVTPADKDRNPTGVAFLSALVIRNLARTLRGEIASALPADHGLSKEEKEEKRRHLQEEQFGLPIPDSILKEEEEEEKTAAGEMEGGLSWEEREKAKLAFEAVEDRVVGVIQGNFSGVGQYLGEAFGW